MKKVPVHKACYMGYGLAILIECGVHGSISTTEDWRKTTCKRCLALRLAPKKKRAKKDVLTDGGTAKDWEKLATTYVKLLHIAESEINVLKAKVAELRAAIKAIRTTNDGAHGSPSWGKDYITPENQRSDYEKWIHDLDRR